MIGLDIGAYSIKAVELEKKAGSLAVVNFKLQERPQEEPLAVSVKKFLETANFISKGLNISLTGQFVSVRIMEFPEMAQGELKEAVKCEMERFISFGIEDAVTDYQIISRDSKTKKLTVLLAAAKTDFVKNYIDMISHAGFNVRAVDINGAALTNTFLNAYHKRDTEGDDNAFVLLNIGDVISSMSIVYKGVPFVLREISIGGRELSEVIAKGLGIDKKQAYQLKHNPGDKKETVAALINPVLNKLCKDIMLSIGYFENQFSKGVAAVYLSGGTSRLFGLKEFLNESLECQIESWNPFTSVALVTGISAKALDDVKEDLAIALGLALRDDD